MMKKSGFVFPEGKLRSMCQKGIIVTHSDTPTVPKDREAKLEEKFHVSKYPGFQAGKLIGEVFYPIDAGMDTDYAQFKSKYNL